ncbi:hypothetical protein SK128_023422 [Halocaridina rubra]|uniref:Uncharacterized protein n=1 Tax=Halocaridina rubra TaxID=373956 RepID=A0AAN8WX97_HALRR
MKMQRRRGGKANQREQGQMRRKPRGGSYTANNVGQYLDFQRGRKRAATGKRGRGGGGGGRGGRGGKGFAHEEGRKGLQVLTSKFGIRVQMELIDELSGTVGKHRDIRLT